MVQAMLGMAALLWTGGVALASEAPVPPSASSLELDVVMLDDAAPEPAPGPRRGRSPTLRVARIELASGIGCAALAPVAYFSGGVLVFAAGFGGSAAMATAGLGVIAVGGILTVASPVLLMSSGIRARRMIVRLGGDRPVPVGATVGGVLMGLAGPVLLIATLQGEAGIGAAAAGGLFGSGLVVLAVSSSRDIGRAGRVLQHGVALTPVVVPGRQVGLGVVGRF